MANSGQPKRFCMNSTLQIHVKPDQQVQQGEQEVEMLAYRQKHAEQQRN